MALTEKQKRFCDEYLIDCNAKQAAIRAGYSPKTAYSIGNENLNKPELLNYIREQLKGLHRDKIADAEEVLEYLTSVMRGDKKELIPISNDSGEIENIEREIATRDKLKAAELLGKRYGVFKDSVKVEEKLTENTVSQLQSLLNQRQKDSKNEVQQ